MAVELAKKTRQRPDPIALATKGRQTSYEVNNDDGLKPKVRIGNIRPKLKVRKA